MTSGLFSCVIADNWALTLEKWLSFGFPERGDATNQPQFLSGIDLHQSMVAFRGSYP